MSTRITATPAIGAIAIISTLLFVSAALAGDAPPPDAEFAHLLKDSSETVRSGTPSRVRMTIVQVPKSRHNSYPIIVVSKTTHGRVELPAALPGGSNVAAANYFSDPGYVGSDSFTWKLTDGTVESNTVTVTITVTEAPPDPQDQPATLAIENTPVVVPAPYFGGAGYDSAIQFNRPAHGAVTLEGSAFRYAPEPGYCGSDVFTWNMTYTKKAAIGAARGQTYSTPTRSCWVLVKKAGVSDWPQYRADEWRSGFSSMSLPGKLSLLWRRELPTTRSPFSARSKGVYVDIDYCRPVQLGKMLFVPITASDCIAAFDTDSGEQRWRYYASGAVRRPPAAMRLPDGGGAVIFGSDDGWVYCLNAADGAVRWKFHAAPNNRMAMGFGRLSSVWPIWASPVLSNGKVYVAAGYLPFTGLYAYCLDAATGAVTWVNDGRITDMWNTSAFGPLAVSYDGTRVYGTVEGAGRPWMVDTASGEFMGHFGVGFKFAGSGHDAGTETRRSGEYGWYVNGKGLHTIPEPLTITVRDQTFTPDTVRELGVTGKVASLLAGDGKLFVTTAEGSLYCFSPQQAQAAVHPLKATPLKPGSDAAAIAVKTILSREDLKQGLALVIGVRDGRMAQELALQSSLMVVAVGTDSRKLQELHDSMDNAGVLAERFSTLEGAPLDFKFAPCQAALIVCEDFATAGLAGGPAAVERLYTYTRPFGGEIWLPTTDAQHSAIAAFVAGSKSMPLCDVTRAGEFTRIARTGLPDEKLRPAPPFGVVEFGSMPELASWNPLTTVWERMDLFSWLPLKAKMPGRVPSPPNFSGEKGYPTAATVSTPQSVYTSLPNPLYGTVEKFCGVPASGNDGSCSATFSRYGDFGLTHGKTSSFFDASSHYWGRLFFPEAGGCPGRTFMWNGWLFVTATPVPGSACGCSAAMQFSNFTVAPMDGEENWFKYQSVRTSNPVEELPVRRIGVNFGAPGDRFDEGLLWTHHPYAGRYGRNSHIFDATPEALPLVPVSYRGPVQSVYHHSAQMEQSAGDSGHTWVAASCVKGMTGLTVHLAQPAVAKRTAVAPKIDGNLDDECWKDSPHLIITANKCAIDRDKDNGQSKPDDHCFAQLRYDDNNLYVAAGTHALYGPHAFKTLTVTLNSRERQLDDVVLTGTDKNKQSTGLDPKDWSYAASPAAPGTPAGVDPFTAEMAIPWSKLADLGLWKEQLLINISVSSSPLTAQYTPLYLDAARGAMAAHRPYTVRLHFAEMDGARPGQRVFDVSLQGQPLLKALDVVQAANGPKRELVREFKGVSIAGALDIDFKATAGEPMLSGVELVAEPAPITENAAPTAAIEASVLSGAAPLAVTFNAQKSTAANGQIVECLWDTGDGRLARGSVLHHVFAEPGKYVVQLLLRDNQGGLAGASVEVNVTAGEPAAFVCAIRAREGDFSSLSSWEAAVRSDLTGTSGKSLLFVTKARGTCDASDFGKPVTFTGGGAGTLRCFNARNICYVSGCQGAIQAGVVKCASGHSFDVESAGSPIYLAVAECYNDWPEGLADAIQASVGETGWVTDAVHCPVIRVAQGQGHTGRMKDAKGLGGFMLKGDLDASAMPHVRLEGLIVDAAATVTAGPGASVSRLLGGNLKLMEAALTANSAGALFSAGNTRGVVNTSPSTLMVNCKDSYYKPKSEEKLSHPRMRVAFINCTAKTFDPANQQGVEFINCLAAPEARNEGFRDAAYSEPGCAFHCMSTDATAVRWDGGDGIEANTANQIVNFVDAANGDVHLAPSDTDLRFHRAPGLGTDLDGKSGNQPRVAGSASAFEK